MDRVMVLRSFLAPIRVLACQQRFAGHSKWQNIAHTKAANDQAKGQKTSRYCAAIRRACGVGGPDPVTNDALRSIIAAALKSNIKKETIERQLERARNLKIKQELIEIMGPGGSFLICEIQTDNISRTRHDMKRIMRKVPGTGMMREGAVRMSFEERGIVIISKKDKNGKMIDKDRAEDIAIEVGAEEVVDEEEADQPAPNAKSKSGKGDDVGTWTLYTTARDVNVVKTKVESLKDVEVIDSESRFLPICLVPLSKDDFSAAASLVEKLEELEEVCAVYDNIKPLEA